MGKLANALYCKQLSLIIAKLMRSILFTSTLCMVLPLVVAAQDSAPASASPHFFVGLGGSIYTYQRLNGFSQNSLAPMLTAGLQVRPRLAVQLGATYRQDTRRSTFAGQRPDNAGQLQPGNYSSVSRARFVSVPLVARYTLTANLAQPFQVDLLGGATLLQNWYDYKEEFTSTTTQTITPNTFDNSSTSTEGFLSLGPSARYRLAPQLDLTGDFLFNYGLQNFGRGSVLDHLSANLMLGVRYHFANR
jgi:hypothetical protein